jgi:hypothetical protein
VIRRNHATKFLTANVAALNREYILRISAVQLEKCSRWARLLRPTETLGPTTFGIILPHFQIIFPKVSRRSVFNIAVTAEIQDAIELLASSRGQLSRPFQKRYHYRAINALVYIWQQYNIGRL